MDHNIEIVLLDPTGTIYFYHDFMFSSGGSSQHICAGFQCVSAEEHPRSYPVLLSLPHESGNKTDNIFLYFTPMIGIFIVFLSEIQLWKTLLCCISGGSHLSTFNTYICRFDYSLVTKIETFFFFLIVKL